MARCREPEMSPDVMADMDRILRKLDAAGESVCAAQLQTVIDTLEVRLSARKQAEQALLDARQP